MWLWRRRSNRDFAEEIQSHIDRETDRLVEEKGLSRDDARAEALRAFGNVTRARERFYESKRWLWLDDLQRDLTYALRALRANPGFTAVTLVTLALGIGANTAIFTLVNATMLKPLPVDEPDRLLELLTDRGDGPGNAFAYQALEYLQQHAQTVDVIASHDSRFFIAIGNESATELASGQYVTGNYFPVLRSGSWLGRTIDTSDDRADAPAVVVLSHRYWTSRFHRDPTVIGHSLRVNDQLFAIIGVAASTFRGLRPAAGPDFWIPLATEPRLRKPSNMSSASYNWLQIVARVRPDSTVARARAELQALYHPAVVETKLTTVSTAADRAIFARWRPVVLPARAGIAVDRQQYGEPLMVLLAISAIVLLIACVNVANLLLARATSRQAELALRVSLGAKRSRLLRQLVTESLTLSIAGAAFGIAIAYAACSYLSDVLASTRTPIIVDAAPDGRVLAFVTALAVITGLVFGLVPARGALSHGSPIQPLRSGSRVAYSRERRRVSRMLVAAQLSLAVVMLVCGGLFLRSLLNLRTVHLGFESRSVLVLSSDLVRGEPTADQIRVMFRGAVEKLRALPGVVSASGANVTPIWGGGIDSRVQFQRTASTIEGQVAINFVGPGYLTTLSTPLVAGRDFSWRESSNTAGVAIVNDMLARRYFGNEPAVGRRVTLRGRAFEIIGIAADAKYYSVRSAVPPTLYLHWLQQEDERMAADKMRQFILRSDGPPAQSVALAAREALREAAPALTVTKMWTLEDQISASMVRDRLLTMLSGAFAIVGLMLAAIGLYGVMAYGVNERTGEIGVRMAMGADTGQIARMIGAEALRLIAIGLTLGLILAMTLSRMLTRLLFDLKPTDPITLMSVILVMVIAGLAASYIPTRRAARVQPMVALRAE